MSKILIFANQQGEGLAQVPEKYCFWQPLASSTGGEVRAVSVGTFSEAGAKEAIAFGASKAYTVSNPLLAEYDVELYVNCTETVFQQSGADVFILSFDRMGKDLVGS